MSASANNPSPEVSGLIAADSGFALVETAFIPASGGIGRASLWVIAAVSLGTLAAAAGVTIAKDPARAIAELPAAPDAARAIATVTAPAPPTVAANIPAAPSETMPAALTRNARVLPVVLRGHPPPQAGNRL